MQIRPIVVAFAAMPYCTSALGAGPAGSPGGFVPATPAGAALSFSVPYSFIDVDKKLHSAVIRCVARPGPKSPPIAAGETTVVLNGQPGSGMATVRVDPLPGHTLSGARFYTCGMRLSDGHVAGMPPSFNANTPFKWTVAKPGSTLEVGGEIK